MSRICLRTACTCGITLFSSLGKAVIGVAQSRMQYRTVLTEIDLLTGEHAITPLFNFCTARQGHQIIQSSTIDALFGVINEESILALKKNDESAGGSSANKSRKCAS